MKYIVKILVLKNLGKIKNDSFPNFKNS